MSQVTAAIWHSAASSVKVIGRLVSYPAAGRRPFIPNANSASAQAVSKTVAMKATLIKVLAADCQAMEALSQNVRRATKQRTKVKTKAVSPGGPIASTGLRPPLSRIAPSRPIVKNVTPTAPKAKVKRYPVDGLRTDLWCSTEVGLTCAPPCNAPVSGLKTDGTMRFRFGFPHAQGD